MAYTNIDKSSLHFNTKLYTGNASTNNITGVGFDPDFSWFKSRAVEVHELYDKVRGAGKRIQSQSTAAQNDESYQSFITDGFAWSGGGNCNSNGVNFVSWNWKANGAGSSNTDGDITSTVSANTTSGFSIIKFTGNSYTSQSFGHGLNGTPKYWMIKNITDSGDNWQVYFNGTDRAKLDTTEVFEQNYLMSANATTITTPSTSGGAWGNANGKDFIVYAFQEIKAFSKMGVYSGNVSLNGPFIFTGFKPAWVMIKCKGLANQSWTIFNNGLNSFNEMTNTLQANTNGAEDGNTTYNDIDFVSNGFKIREDNDNINATGQDYIYIAFAEAPLVGSNNVPCTAR